MLELGGELDLAAEAVDVDAGGELGREHLDHDLPARAPFLGQEDAAHPAAAELALEAVRAAERVLQLPEGAPALPGPGRMRKV